MVGPIGPVGPRFVDHQPVAGVTELVQPVKVKEGGTVGGVSGPEGRLGAGFGRQPFAARQGLDGGVGHHAWIGPRGRLDRQVIHIAGEGIVRDADGDVQQDVRTGIQGDRDGIDRHRPVIVKEREVKGVLSRLGVEQPQGIVNVSTLTTVSGLIPGVEHSGIADAGGDDDVIYLPPPSPDAVVVIAPAQDDRLASISREVELPQDAAGHARVVGGLIVEVGPAAAAVGGDVQPGVAAAGKVLEIAGKGERRISVTCQVDGRRPEFSVHAAATGPIRVGGGAHAAAVRDGDVVSTPVDVGVPISTRVVDHRPVGRRPTLKVLVKNFLGAARGKNVYLGKGRRFHGAGIVGDVYCLVDEGEDRQCLFLDHRVERDSCGGRRHRFDL